MCCRSTVPTAFTGYSFHVAEAALVFANEVLVCFLLPLHVGLHRAYHLFTTVIHQGELRKEGAAWQAHPTQGAQLALSPVSDRARGASAAMQTCDADTHRGMQCADARQGMVPC